MKLILIKKMIGGQVEKTVVTPGMNVLSQAGVRYELIDENTGKAPKGLKVKRKGNTLELEVDGEKVIELDDFIDSDAVLDVTTPNGEMISLDGNSPALAQENGFDVLYGAQAEHDAAELAWPVWALTALGLGGATALAVGGGGDSTPPSAGPDVTPPAAPAAITGYADDIGRITNPNSTAPVTDDNRPGFNVGTGLTDTPSLYVDGVKVPATYDPVTGMLTPTTPLADGAHSITTTLTDAAGNESPQSAALPLTVDTAAPAAPTGVTVTDDVAPVTGAIAANGASNDNKPTFAGAAGSAEAGSTITVMDGATVLGTAVVAADGSWSVTPTTALADGAHSITTRATDAAGNVSPVSPALALTVDTVAPTTTASVTAIRDDVGAITGTVASGGVTDDTSLVVSGTLSTGLITGERVRIYDGSSYLGDATVSGTSWTYADSRTLTDGQSVSYTARVSDPAGNQSAAGTAYTATVDTLDTFTWGGETHALNLVARVNAQDGKTYYALDANGDGVHDTNDRVTHNWLDGLLNGGADTVDTQPGGAVKGVDDARTVIINGYTLVLPMLT